MRPEESGPEAADFERESIPHLDALYGYAIVFANDAEEAEVWVRDAILDAHRRWPRRDPETDIRVWLLTILRDIVATHRRLNGGGVSADSPDPADSMPIPGIHESDPRVDFLEFLQSDEILESLARLPYEFAEVVILNDIEGLNYAEVAEITDAEVGVVKSRIFRGRRLLQRDLYRKAVALGYRPKLVSPTEP